MPLTLSKLTGSFYVSIAIALLAIAIFFWNLPTVVIPFLYHDEFNYILPILAKWGEGTLTLGDIWAQQANARFPLSSIAYITLAEIFGENFYAMGIYLTYSIISIVSLIMIFRARSSVTEMLIWLAILIVILTPRATQVHFFLYASLDILHLFLIIVVFSSIKLTSSRKSGAIYAALFALAISYRMAIFIVPFFMFYYLLQHLWNTGEENISAWRKIAVSIVSIDGFVIAGLCYLALTGVYFIGYHSTPLPAPPSHPTEFLLNLLGGAFVGLADVKPVGLFLIIIIAWLSRNTKTIITSLGVFMVLLALTLTRCGLGEDYAFQSRYYIYSAAIFALLIINLETLSNMIVKRVLQWSYLALVLGLFLYWANSDYPERFAVGKQAAYNAYLENNLFHTKNTLGLHPELDEQMYHNFMLTLKHGYFQKPADTP